MNLGVEPTSSILSYHILLIYIELFLISSSSFSHACLMRAIVLLYLSFTSNSPRTILFEKAYQDKVKWQILNSLLFAASFPFPYLFLNRGMDAI